ncbi:hypothetical protein [Halomonas sp.]|uniref:hypothetical protein n=1 Tax=Halomonas sp. TaxID=1486246 RepID=UPI0035674E50
MRIPVTPRAFRLMLALLNRPHTREECDRLAPASNSPHYVGELRHRLKLALPCERVPFVTTDGAESWFGRYHATPDDRDKIRAILANLAAANDGQEKAPHGQG